MGVLDEAIREHLELKRAHGASEEELKRQEQEALGPPRRDRGGAPDSAGEEARAGQVDELGDHADGSSSTLGEPLLADELDDESGGELGEPAPGAPGIFDVEELPPRGEPAPAAPSGEADLEMTGGDAFADELELDREELAEEELAEELAGEQPAGEAPPEAMLDSEDDLYGPDDLERDDGLEEPDDPATAVESLDTAYHPRVVDPDVEDDTGELPIEDVGLTDPRPEEPGAVPEEPGATVSEPRPADPDAAPVDEILEGEVVAEDDLLETEDDVVVEDELLEAEDELLESELADEDRDPEGAEGLAAPAEGEGEDVLEETPEFLQETPEDERLWFEQKPPRDFDIDR